MHAQPLVARWWRLQTHSEQEGPAPVITSVGLHACTKLMMAAAFIGAALLAHTWTHKTGYLERGSEALPPAVMSLTEAYGRCANATSCVGFTFESAAATPAARVKCYFKSRVHFDGMSGWQTYLKDYIPPPPLLQNPCMNTSLPFSRQLWCNPAADLGARVEDMLHRMTAEEKISLLGTSSPAVPSLGLGPYNWWSEASHGVASGGHGAREIPTTNFAFPITTAMAFNRSLWRATGGAIGREARAAMNLGKAYSTFWAPVINLAREPRWARNIETPGEDPYTSGEYAIAFVKGMQEAEEDPSHLLSSACCKHYVANSMDGSTVDGTHHMREEFDATISTRDLIDSYMVPFQACVEEGRVSGLMCSYNAVNGVPTCASDWLLSTVARGDWQFQGYITSDCDADNDVFAHHHYTKTPEASVAAVLRAGTDVDCGDFVPKNAPSALKHGYITIGDIDARLEQLFRVRMRLGHFDPPGPLQAIPRELICSAAHQAMAEDGAAQGSTLLKNEHAALPLQAAHTIAVIGPNANLSRADANYYGPGNVCNGRFWTLVDGIAAHSAHAPVSSLGVPSVRSSNTSGVATAAKLAASADRVVLALGTDLSWAHEGMDADPVMGLRLSDGQNALLEAVCAAAKAPVVVVLMTATPLDISALLAHPKVGAVLHTGQPAVAVRGVAAALYGARPPAGRMVQTVYPATYATQVSIFDFNMRPGPSAWPAPGCTRPAAQCANGTNPGRTYRFFTGTPVVPFGFGLSYTDFRYSVRAHAPPHSTPGPDERQGTGDMRPVLSLAPLRALLQRHHGKALLPRTDVAAHEPLIRYAVNVTNAGGIDSDEVVLGFVRPPGAGVDGVPLKVLFGFERVHVKAGQSVLVWLYPALSVFAHAEVDGTWSARPGEYMFSFGVRETRQGYDEHRVLAA